ncbi:MAG: hypothetical protein K0Q72_598 [Armatimonadetes bacterium]|jgi:hypothetical protein|nr:hypothetical protein [Armatimonadota bacterium]
MSQPQTPSPVAGTVPLEPWPYEPAVCQFLGLYYGFDDVLHRFVQLWFDRQGDLELWIRALKPAEVPPALLRNGRAPHAIAFSRLPDYHLLGWFLRQPEWELYYGRTPADDTEVTVARALQDLSANPRPLGWYQPWSFGQHHTTPVSETGVGLILETGARVNLGHRDQFESLFRSSKGGLPAGPRVMSGRGPEPRIKATPAPSPRSQYPIPIRLFPDEATDRPGDPLAAMEALQYRITELEEELQNCRWWSEQSELPVYLSVYPETDESGGAAALRHWFCRSPEAVIRQFRHARVEVGPLGPDFPPLPPLHLVRPAQYDQPPIANLPPAAYRMVLDPWWKERDRQVFTPEHWLLRPPPPQENAPVLAAMEECLWDKAKRESTLIFFRFPDGRECRFAVDEWKSLEEQIPTLNLQLAEARREAKCGPAAQEALKTMVQHGHADADRHFTSLRAEMQKSLDTIWSRERANVDTYRDEIVKLLKAVNDLQHRRSEINTLRSTDWSTWTAFLTSVLELDRNSFPFRFRRLRDTAVELDRLRLQLTEFAANPTVEQRGALAAALRQAADTLQSGGL